MENTLEQQWLSHIDTCPQCSTVMTDWRDLRKSIQRPHLQSAPRPVLASAYAMFQVPPPRNEKSAIRRIVAALSFDSLSQPAFAGARGTAAARKMVLRAEEFDVHVRLWIAEESRELLGQIQPRDTGSLVDSARVYLLQNGEKISSTGVNELGEFQFRFVPPGLLSLQIDLPHLTVICGVDVSDEN